ncbi:MAG: hypothetical protein R3E11_04705 [Sphingobium sp.]|nr:hypothetical protein [Sphingobium sp.]MCP5398794.1 hypothetical protein [Sphingomonas sp.]
MAISGDYSTPITVNGFVCRNCSDVAKAEKNIDPADPTGAKERAKKDAKGDDIRFDQQRVEDAIAAHQAQADEVRKVDGPARAYETNGYTPPPPGSLIRLSA